MNRWEGTPTSTVSPFRARKRVGANQVSYSVLSTTCSNLSRTCRQTFMDGGDLYLSDNPQVFHSCGKSFHGIGGRSLVAVGRAKQGVSLFIRSCSALRRFGLFGVQGGCFTGDP